MSRERRRTDDVTNVYHLMWLMLYLFRDNQIEVGIAHRLNKNNMPKWCRGAWNLALNTKRTISVLAGGQ